MSEGLFRFICFLCCIVAATAVGWLFWGPALSFAQSFIPPNAEGGWIGELIVLVAVAYFGGVGLPLFFLILGFVLLFVDLD